MSRKVLIDAIFASDVAYCLESEGYDFSANAIRAALNEPEPDNVAGDKGNWYGAFMAAKKENDKLRAERDALQERCNILFEDSERYQFLVDGTDPRFLVQIYGFEYCTTLDSAIDAAMGK